MRQRAMALMVAMAVGLGAMAASPAMAETGPSQVNERYGIYYGDGLRALAEGEPQEAVKALFRAYGLRPSGQVMGLIIEAYDDMGHCDAVQRQQAMMAVEHPDAESADLGSCGQSAELTVRCPDGEEAISIDGMRLVECHRRVTVPAGQKLRLRGVDSGDVQRLTLDDGQAHELSWEVTEPDVDIARLALGGDVGRLDSQQRADVPRVSGQRLRSEFDSRNAVYHVWQSESAGFEDRPTVELICPEGTTSAGERCILLRDDGGERNYDVLVPRIP